MGEVKKIKFRQESIMAQKARIKWVREGDSNSRFFHSIVNWRRRTNTIRGLDINGRWTEEPKLVKEEIVQFFTKRFEQSPNQGVFLDGVQFRRLDGSDNDVLTRAFTEEEVKEAIWSCDGSRSPGPDGFNFKFIKQFWMMLKEDIMAIFSEFHAHRKLPKGSNASFLTLIPKKEITRGLGDYRPISLIGSLYKIISKVLALRMRAVMHKVIEDTQSAFVKDRQMLNSVAIVNETIHEAKSRKKPILLFKADFEKAYDTVSWVFLYYMMERMGFCPTWVNWIKCCISSASVSALVNGSATCEFPVKRGLRQGDPLAPSLFLIVAEGLGGLVREACRRKMLSGLEVGKDRVPICLQQFADDTFLFLEPNMRNVLVLKSILRCFEAASGLKINFHKSSLGGIAVGTDLVARFASFLKCRILSVPFIYLGIPVGANVRNELVWKPVIQKMQKRLSTWRQRNLSIGGRVTLINSTLSAIPLFMLSMYEIPKKVAKTLIKIQRTFLWGGTEGKRGITWVKWSDVCRRKEDGGLGIKDIYHFNQALICKWRWRAITEQDALWARVLRSKYGDLTRTRDLSRNTKISQWWRDVTKLTDDPESGAWFWRRVVCALGDGERFKFW